MREKYEMCEKENLLRSPNMQPPPPPIKAGFEGEREKRHAPTEIMRERCAREHRRCTLRVSMQNETIPSYTQGAGNHQLPTCETQALHLSDLCACGCACVVRTNDARTLPVQQGTVD